MSIVLSLILSFSSYCFIFLSFYGEFRVHPAFLIRVDCLNLSWLVHSSTVSSSFDVFVRFENHQAFQLKEGDGTEPESTFDWHIPIVNAQLPEFYVVFQDLLDANS